MKTRIQSLSFLATLAIALISWGSTLYAQNTPSTTPDRQAQQPPSASSADSGAAAGTQTFSGTVLKQKDKYVLKDDSGHTYDIDHQDEVKKFEGKRVRVQGTLDPATNKIMVK